MVADQIIASMGISQLTPAAASNLRTASRRSFSLLITATVKARRSFSSSRFTVAGLAPSFKRCCLYCSICGELIAAIFVRFPKNGNPPDRHHDIRMPGRDGLWLAEQIRERWPRTAIIMASGADDIRSIETSRRIGALVLGLRYRRTRRELAESLGTDFAMREPVQRRRRPHLHEKPRHSSEPIVVAWTFVCLVMDKRKIRALMTAA